MESTRFLMALCASLCIILPAEAQPDQETSTEKKAEMEGRHQRHGQHHGPEKKCTGTGKAVGVRIDGHSMK